MVEDQGQGEVFNEADRTELKSLVNKAIAKGVGDVVTYLRKQDEIERRTREIVTEKVIALLTAVSGGCLFLILGHKLHPGYPVRHFCIAAASFTLGVCLTVAEIAMGPTFIEAEDVFSRADALSISYPAAPRVLKVASRTKKFWRALLILSISSGISHAACGTYAETKCYVRPAQETCELWTPVGP